MKTRFHFLLQLAALAFASAAFAQPAPITPQNKTVLVDPATGAVVFPANFFSGNAANLAGAAPVQSVAGRTGAVTLTSADLTDTTAFTRGFLAAVDAAAARTALGLGNVDNTSDANKPISTATQTALNLKANLASPALTGTPTAPTAAPDTNTTQIATTAYAKAEADAAQAYAIQRANHTGTQAWSTLTGTPTTLSGYGISDAVGTSRTISTTAPLAGGGALSGNLTLTIADAAADGTTKGAATFAAADFNASGGVITLDYANAQKASSSQHGFLSSTDWSTFNAKEPAPVFVSQATSFSVTTNDRGKVFVVNTSSAVVTITPPSAADAGAGFSFSVIKTDDGSGNALILDGVSALTSANTLYSIVSDGSEWLTFAQMRADGSLRFSGPGGVDVFSASHTSGGQLAGPNGAPSVDAGNRKLYGEDESVKLDWSGDGFFIGGAGGGEIVPDGNLALGSGNGDIWTFMNDGVNGEGVYVGPSSKIVAGGSYAAFSKAWVIEFPYTEEWADTETVTFPQKSGAVALTKSFNAGTKTGTTAVPVWSYSVWKMIPGGDCTLTVAPQPIAMLDGAVCTILIEATASSRTITFGTGFVSQGTLTTGSVAGKYFAVTFVNFGGLTGTWVETSRTTAM